MPQDTSLSFEDVQRITSACGLGYADAVNLHAALTAVSDDPLLITNARVPSTFQAKLPQGVTDPWEPTDWIPGSNTFVLHQRVSEFNSYVKCLPRATDGEDILFVVVNAGDGGGTFTQTGVLEFEHMAAAYDPGQLGDNTDFLPFYLPGQKNMFLRPGDAAFFRQDEGHESYRCIATTNGSMVKETITSTLALRDKFTFVAASGSQQPDEADWQTMSRMYVDTTAGAATFEGVAPPDPAIWNDDAGAYRPHGGNYRRIWNLGPNTLTLPRLSGSGTAGWQFLPAASITLQPFDSVGMWYEPFGSGFWVIDK